MTKPYFDNLTSYPEEIYEATNRGNFNSVAQYIEETDKQISELAEDYQRACNDIRYYYNVGAIKPHNPPEENGLAIDNLLKIKLDTYEEDSEIECLPFEGVFYAPRANVLQAQCFENLNQTKEKLKKILSQVNRQRCVHCQTISDGNHKNHFLTLAAAFLMETPLQFANLKLLYRKVKILGRDNVITKVSYRCFTIPTYKHFSPQALFQNDDIPDKKLAHWIENQDIPHENLIIKYFGKSTRLNVKYEEEKKSKQITQSIPSIIFMDNGGLQIENKIVTDKEKHKRPSTKYKKTPFSKKYKLYQKRAQEEQITERVE